MSKAENRKSEVLRAKSCIGINSFPSFSMFTVNFSADFTNALSF